jgi:hypothetical protein
LLESRQRGWWWVGVIVLFVVVPIILNVVGGDTVPCVSHLKYER